MSPGLTRPGQWLLASLVALAVLLGVASCSVLPTLVPDLSRRERPPVPLTGAQGPLSAARSRAVLARLQLQSQPTDIFQRHLALEESVAGSPMTTGNRVQLLLDGQATFSAMLAAIEAATDHVNLETYILDDDDVGRRFAAALIERQRAGVQVQVIRDSAGTLRTPAAFFEQLRAAGVRVLEFNPLNPLLARKTWELNRRDHRKLLIVDGRVAFLGGVNISIRAGRRAAACVPGRPRRRPGATPTCRSAARWWRRCSGSSWTPGRRNKGRRCRCGPGTRHRRCKGRRWCACWPARPTMLTAWPT